MKIIKRNSDNVVIYAGEDLTLDTRASNGEWVDASASTATHALIDGMTLPADWAGGAYTYNGAWAYTTSGQAYADVVLSMKKTAWFKAIDAAAIAVYDRPTTLGDEYKEREAEATAFRAAGYTGTVPPRIAGFATPANMTPQAATDLILSQAAQLRGALAQIADLRMQKYAVKNAASETASQAVYTQTMNSIAAIAAALG
jgi:hypothetical protein